MKKFDDLFKMSPEDTKKFYHDLTTKHLTTDFYQITADCMDPKQQSIIILEPSQVEDNMSKNLIKSTYYNDIKSVNSLNKNYQYKIDKPADDQPVIILKEQENKKDPDDQVKIRQVIPFNLWLGFTLPMAISTPHILPDALAQQLNPFIHQYAEHLLLNWINIPWLLSYRIANPDISLDSLIDHSISQYQIDLFNEGLDISFDIAQKKDESQFITFLNSQTWPQVTNFQPSTDAHFYQLQINRQNEH